MRVHFSQGGGKQKARPQGHLSALATPLMGNKVIYFLSPVGGEDKPVSSRASPAGSTAPGCSRSPQGSGGSHLPPAPNLPNCCLGHSCEDTGSSHHPPHTHTHIHTPPSKNWCGGQPLFRKLCLAFATLPSRSQVALMYLSGSHGNPGVTRTAKIQHMLKGCCNRILVWFSF